MLVTGVLSRVAAAMVHFCAVMGTALTLGALVAPAVAAAEGCPNEAVRKLEPYGSALPDCRAYEQVSPVEKNSQDVIGNPGSVVQAAPGGEAITFESSFAFPGTLTTGNNSIVNYLSNRTEAGWSTQGVDPVSEAEAAPWFKGSTEDLRYSIFEAKEPPLTANAQPGEWNMYLRDNETGEYSLAVPARYVFFADESAGDAYMLFEHVGALPALPEASSGNNVYVDHEGALSVANIVEGVAVPAVAGGGGPAAQALGVGAGVETGVVGGSDGCFFQQDTISQSGSRVFFTDLENGQVYAREDGTSTVEVSKSQTGGEELPAYWRAATPDGRYVFFTSEAKLTVGATAGPGHPDLYRYDFDAPEGDRLLDLSAVAGGGEVAGVLGVSEDGTYAYFVAGAVLAAGAAAEAANLYVWHENEATHTASVTFVAEIEEGLGLGESAVDAPVGFTNWEAEAERTELPGDEGDKSSRVTPDGRTVIFVSTSKLTGYENAGYLEVYRYRVGSGGLDCVSCNPSGAAATAGAQLGGNTSPIREGRGLFKNAVLSRNLSADGERVFFETGEALVPGDTNGAEECPDAIEDTQTEVLRCQDVYEWEADGSGSCRSEAQNGGCLFLISTGTSDEPSWFVNASVEGENVFFFTGQSLVSQDVGEERDLYDAREGGGLVSQNEPPPCSGEGCGGPPCESAEACKPPPSEAPALLVPGSAGFAGPGNLAVPPPPAQAKIVTPPSKPGPRKACPRGRRRSRGRCVAVRHRRRRPRASRQGMVGRRAGR